MHYQLNNFLKKKKLKEIQDDINIDYPKCGDLSSWGKQGVLLLNSTLTVEEGKPGSHQKKGWETFTDEIIATPSVAPGAHFTILEPL